MTKQQFLNAVEARLAGLSPSDIQKSLDYYNEMIDDRIEDGISEDDAVTAMGDPAEAARQILSELSLPKLIRAKNRTRRKLAAWELILLILGSPLWITLLAAAFVVVLAAYIVIWSLLLAVWVVDFVFAVVGIALLPSSIFTMLSGGVVSLLLFLGAGCLLIGLAIMLFFGALPLSRLAIRASRGILMGIKKLFIGKGEGK